MIIDMRKDAPDQSQTIDPSKLSEEVEKLQTIQKEINDLENRLKDKKEKVNEQSLFNTRNTWHVY